MNVFDKILERLEEIKGCSCDSRSCSECEYTSDCFEGEMSEKVAIDMAKEIVQEVAEEYNNGLIPCSERLPEEGVDVLVWFEYFRYGSFDRLYQTIGISYTYKGDWSGFVNGSSGWRDLRIIAWQPLPEPYHPKGE